MTTRIYRPLTTSGAIFQWRSLKTRVTIFTLAIFLIGIWSLAFYASRMLQRDLQRMLSEQQFSTVSLMAREINKELDLRLRSIEDIASRISPAMIGDRASLQEFITNRSVLHVMFNGGLFVTRSDGTIIANYPLSASRAGMQQGDGKGWMGEALKGKSGIGKPIIGKETQGPLFSMAAPVRDPRGGVIAVLVGVVDMNKPNFLDQVTNNRYGKTGGYVLIAPQHKLSIAATDRSRIMQPTPAPGINPLFDRYAQGYEGSGMTVDSRGQEVLSSSKQIPVAGWILVGRIPTEEALAPIRALLWRVLLATIFLTLLAGSLTWWLLKRQLAPIFTTIKTLAALAEQDHPPQPLPITRNDEIGELLGGFNHLLESLRQREEALRVSEERYHSLFEQAGDGIFILDTQGTILSVNRSFAEMHGYTVEEMLRMGLEGLDVEGAVPAPERIRQIMDGETLSFEVQHHHKDGHIFPLAVTANLVSWRNEQAIIALHRNLTERQRAEEERRSLEARLQRAEKMEALGTLAGGVAHDLNNVLGIVVGYAELLIAGVDESSPLRDDLLKIMEGGNRAAAIVQDLLTLARRGVQTGQVFNLNAAIAACQNTPEYEKVLSFNPRVRVETRLEADLLNIMGSPVHLGKTFINLVANAVEAMPGGGMLTIATSNQSLDKPVHGYDAVNPGDYVVLSIADTGEGISDRDIRHIFEPFYTKKVMGKSGTGLGLAVVWGTVKDHNGYIDVKSEIGKGTTFTLYFPVTREEIARAEEVVPLSAYIGNDESILVIDDIKEQRELAAKMLGKLNYKVKTVSSGEEAVDYLRTNRADLLVLDMIMDPGIDGLDTYKAIIEIHPRQKAIIVSGFSETKRVEEARALGAGEYLRKPYMIEKLGLAVRRELERKSTTESSPLQSV